MEKLDSSEHLATQDGILKHFLSFFLLTSILLVSVEAVLELRAYSRGYDTVLFGRKANTEFSNTLEAPSDKGPTTHVFSHTDVDSAPKYNSASRRYWVASASHALYGASKEKRFTNLLCANTPDCSAVNGSSAGWTIERSVNAYKESAEDFDAQFVVFYHLSMDLFYYTNGDRERAANQGTNKTVPLVDFSPAHKLFERFTLYSMLKGFLKTTVTMYSSLKPEVEEAFYTRLMSDVGTFVNLVRSNSQTPVLTTFPMPWTINDKSIPYNTRQFILKRQNKYTVDAWLEAIDRANELLREYASKENIVLVDLDKSLSGKKAVFKDLVHLNAKGHKLVAESIREQLGVNHGI